MAARVEHLLPPPVETKHHPLGFSFALYEPTNIVWNTDDVKAKIGVRKVRRANSLETPEYMLAHVAKKLFHSDEQIDLLGVASSFPVGENLSGLMIDVLDLNVRNNIDIYAACSGYARFLLHIAELAQDQDLNGWNIGFASTERYSPFLKKGTFDTGIFTDGAIGLSNLRYGENFRILSAVGRSLDPETSTSLTMPVDRTLMEPPFIEEPVPPSSTGMFEMNGPVVYRNIIDPQRGVPTLINDVLEVAECTPDDIDYLIPHQGSSKTNRGLIHALPEFEGKIIEDITDGNLSSGSIPRALSRLTPSHDPVRILNVGFGAGLYGVAAITEHGNLASQR